MEEIKTNNRKEKNHYFIGNIFDDEEDIRILNKVKGKLKQRYNLKNFHWNNKYFTNMIYLGYLDKETAYIYMDNIITPLLNAIGDKVHLLNCNFTGFKLEYDHSFYKISLKFTDQNNYLEKIIIPYLYNNAIVPIYEHKHLLKPAIDLIYYKNSNKLNGNKSGIKIEVPKHTFQIKHFSLIRGTNVRLRAGTPSLHDQMSLEEINRYTVPLLKNNKNNNNKMVNSFF